MQNLRNALNLALVLGAVTGIANAGSYTYVPITSVANNNIQTSLISAVPTGTFTAGNALATPFSIPTGSNFYDGFGFGGSGQSISFNVNVTDATDVYSLMNAYTPAATELASVTVYGSLGQETFELIGGADIRDFYQGEFVNSLTNGVSGVTAENAFTCVDPNNCLGGGGTGNVNNGDQGTYVVDEQDFSLAPGLTGETVTQIVITDTYNGSDPILLGLTVGSQSVAVTPEPASFGLVALAMAAMLAFPRVRNLLSGASSH